MEGLPQRSRAKGLVDNTTPSPQQSASAPGRCRANPAPESSGWAATASATTAASRACGRRPSFQQEQVVMRVARRT